MKVTHLELNYTKGPLGSPVCKVPAKSKPKTTILIHNVTCKRCLAYIRTYYGIIVKP